MKTEAPKQDELKTVVITVDPALDKLFAGKVLFPEKLAQANEFLTKHPLPTHSKKQKP